MTTPRTAAGSPSADPAPDEVVATDHVLDDPVSASLTGRHAHLARRVGRALAYRPDVASFCSVPVGTTAGDWRDLTRLLGPGELADLFSNPAEPPADWEPVFTMSGLQLVAHTVPRPDPSDPFDPSGTSQTVRGSRPRHPIVELGRADADAMLDLVARTEPGPFWPRTPELGTYLGIRVGPALVAMAGERLRPPGWTEISAVCTAPAFRGRGLATALVSELAARIRARGERPFLHVAADNLGAIRLYEGLGFRVRRAVTFRGFRTPS